MQHTSIVNLFLHKLEFLLLLRMEKKPKTKKNTEDYTAELTV